MRAFIFLVCIFCTINICAQSFTAERGGYYFFAPIKEGFVGMSTVGLNIGVGEYISSGNTVSTFYADGSIKGTATIDCKDGITAGFANENNNFSYLTSSFYSSKNSFYKMVLYLASKEAKLDRVNINVKSLFGRELGRGKYTLDLNYGLAADSAFVFIFSKYVNDSVSYYCVKVNNRDSDISMVPLTITSADVAVKNGTESELSFVFDGNNHLAAIQMNKSNEEDYHLVVNAVSLDSLVLVEDRVVALPFLNKEFNLCPWSENTVAHTFDAKLPSILDRGFTRAPSWAGFEFFNGKILMSGLYYNTKNSAVIGQRADGMFKVNIETKDSLISTCSQTTPFKYSKDDQVTPDYSCITLNDKRYCALIYQLNNKMVGMVDGVTTSNEVMKSASPIQGLIRQLDSKRVVDRKDLREGRSKIYESQLGVFCLYDLKSNSVGAYTRFIFKDF